MLEIICIVFTEVWWTEIKRKILNKNMSKLGIEPATLLFPKLVPKTINQRWQLTRYGLNSYTILTYK